MNKDNEFFKDQGTLDEEMHLQEETLALVVDALLEKRAPQLPVGILDHVENCSCCQARILETFAYLKNPLAEPATARIQSMFLSKKRGALIRMPLAGRVAATLFVGALLAAVYFSFSRNDSLFSPADRGVQSLNDRNKTAAFKQNPDPSRPIKTKNILPKQKETFSGNARGKSAGKNNDFAINHNLEFMVDSRSRSFIVEVYSPVNNSSQTEGIMFSWREFGHEPLNLVILNNRNETVFKTPVSNGHYQCSDKLPAGCYYWKLESANELYYVGKFFVGADSMSPK
jgi:hypothetical protein